MTMRYRHKRSAQSRFTMRVVLYTCVCAALFLIDTFSGSFGQRWMQTVYVKAVTPIQEVTTDRLFAYIRSKQALEAENAALRSQVAQLEQSVFATSEATQSLASICALLPVDAESLHTEIPINSHLKTGVLARVVNVDSLLLGSLLVSFMQPYNANVGEYVFDDAGYVLGVISATNGTSATVSLLTRAAVDEPVRIGQFATTVSGKLNNTFIARVPQEATVAISDIVMHMKTGSPLGEVVYINKSPADAEVVLYIRPFANPQTPFVFADHQ